MSEQKPVILSIDDDPGVSRAVQRDLRRQYGKGFRVLRAESRSQGLEMLGQVRLESSAGDTRFQVRLPIDGPGPAG